jgi:hypothetical protein
MFIGWVCACVRVRVCVSVCLCVGGGCACACACVHVHAWCDVVWVLWCCEQQLPLFRALTPTQVAHWYPTVPWGGQESSRAIPPSADASDSPSSQARRLMSQFVRLARFRIRCRFVSGSELSHAHPVWLACAGWAREGHRRGGTRRISLCLYLCLCL